MQVLQPSLPSLGLTSVQDTSAQSQLSAAPVLSFGSSEEVLALVKNQSTCEDSLIEQATAAAAPDVSAYAYSNDVLQELLAMLIKSDQPAQLPVIAETPGTANPEPPIKPCPNVLQNWSFPLCPQSQSPAGTLSILATPSVNSAVGTTKIAAAASPDAIESRSWDNLVQFLMTNSTGDTRRNSTGSLRAQATSGFRVPQARNVLLLQLITLGFDNDGHQP